MPSEKIPLGKVRARTPTRNSTRKKVREGAVLFWYTKRQDIRSSGQEAEKHCRVDKRDPFKGRRKMSQQEGVLFSSENERSTKTHGTSATAA